MSHVTAGGVIWMAGGAWWLWWLHMSMSHVPCEIVMSHVNESCHGRWGHMDGRRHLMTMMTPIGLGWVMWMSDVLHLIVSYHTCEWVRSHTWMRSLWWHWLAWGESCHTCEWVVSHTNESCHIYTWFMSRVWMSHVTHINELGHTYKWVRSHIWMQSLWWLRLAWGESCHTCEWVMSHMWMSHVTHTNESCRTYEWDDYDDPDWRGGETHFKYEGVTSHMWLCRVTHANEWVHTYESVRSQIWMRWLWWLWFSWGELYPISKNICLFCKGAL